MAHQVHYRAICRRTSQYRTRNPLRTLRCNGSECSHQASLARAWRSLHELKTAIDGGATMLLIDVREDYEVESGSMPGSIHIPLAQLEGRMSDIPKDVRLVFF